MNLTKNEMINLIYSCINIDKEIIEKEICPTIKLDNNQIRFSLDPKYYVLPTNDDLNVVITFSNQSYNDGKIIQECLIMSPISQEIIDEQHLFYYISIPMLKDKKANNEEMTDWELAILKEN